MMTASRIVGVFFAIAVFAPLLWMLMDREPPYTFEHVEISPQEVEQGGEIQITFTIKQNRPACGPGLVYREFKEVTTGIVHVADPVMRAEAPIPIDNKFTRPARLPTNMPPGPTIYRGMACYTCNLVHSWLRWPVCTATPGVTFFVRQG